MRFLADECLDGRVMAGLRSAGHEVLAVRDSDRGASDAAVLAAAGREQRVLVTEDKGLGELLMQLGSDQPGVVLLRYSQSEVSAVRERLLAVIQEHGERLHGMHVVVAPDRVRVRHRRSEGSTTSR